jgi:N,N'-diacetyllegionaminate synthase
MTFLDKTLKNKSCIIVAEIGQAHDGSLGMAHAYIDAVADAGADAIKFQTHIAEAESTPDEPWRVKFSYQDKTRYDYWKRMEFTLEQWMSLAKHAYEKGLIFFSSPFSLEAVDLLENLDVPIWKIGSGEITCKPLIEKILSTHKPIIISTGMCKLEELDNCVKWVRDAKNQLVIMQCTTAYPCPPEKVGLNLLSFYRNRYKSLVGLSDHTGSIYPGVIAASMGASIVEVHVTFSRQSFGPDVKASLTIEELKSLIEGINFVTRMNENPEEDLVNKTDFCDLRDIFYKSLVAKADLAAGTIINEYDVTFKKPGNGIAPIRMNEFIGRKLITNVRKDQQFKEEDFERNKNGR